MSNVDENEVCLWHVVVLSCLMSHAKGVWKTYLHHQSFGNVSIQSLEKKKMCIFIKTLVKNFLNFVCCTLDLMGVI